MTILYDITYEGPPISDRHILREIPIEYSRLLRRVNGLIAFNGGLHIRGAVMSPRWHSLREVWFGDVALYRLFPALTDTDIPFGQDYLGDQFVLRETIVHRLSGESGKLESLQISMDEFLQRAEKDPVNFLLLEPLLDFMEQQGELKPGQLINVLPPFVLKESEHGVSMRAIPVFDQISFLADLSRQIRGLEDGTPITLKVLKKPTGH